MNAAPGWSLAQTANVFQVTTACEPQLGRRGLYPTLSSKTSYSSSRRVLDVLAYADGHHDLIALGERLGASALECLPLLMELEKQGLVKRVS